MGAQWYDGLITIPGCDKKFEKTTWNSEALCQIKFARQDQIEIRMGMRFLLELDLNGNSFQQILFESESEY